MEEQEPKNTSVEDGAGTLEPPTDTARVEDVESSEAEGAEATSEGDSEESDGEEEQEDEEGEEDGEEDDSDVVNEEAES